MFKFYRQLQNYFEMKRKYGRRQLVKQLGRLEEAGINALLDSNVSDVQIQNIEDSAQAVANELGIVRFLHITRGGK